MSTAIDGTGDHARACCNICREAFTQSGDHAPLSMPCGHSACSACVASFEKRECHVCRKKFGREDLPYNYALIDSLQTVGQKRTIAITSDELFALAQKAKAEEENAAKLVELAVRLEKAEKRCSEAKRKCLEAERERSEAANECDEIRRQMELIQPSSSSSSSSIAGPTRRRPIEVFF